MVKMIHHQDVAQLELASGYCHVVAVGEGLMLCRNEEAAGAISHGHRHPEEEMGFVISGTVELRVGDSRERVLLTAGTLFRVAPNEYHESTVMQDAVTIDAFAPPRPEYREGAVSLA